MAERDRADEPVIRPARAGDCAAIQACAAAAYAPYVERIGRKPAPMVADFAAQIAAGQVHVLVEAGEIRGFAVFYPRGDHLHLENVAVDPTWHGRGHGRRLVAFVEQEARRLGLAAVELYTNEMMTENLVLYPRLGYRERGRGEQDGFCRVYFRKTLGSNRC